MSKSADLVDYVADITSEIEWVRSEWRAFQEEGGARISDLAAARKLLWRLAEMREDAILRLRETFHTIPEGDPVTCRR